MLWSGSWEAMGTLLPRDNFLIGSLCVGKFLINATTSRGTKNNFSGLRARAGARVCARELSSRDFMSRWIRCFALACLQNNLTVEVLQVRHFVRRVFEMAGLIRRQYKDRD